MKKRVEDAPNTVHFFLRSRKGAPRGVVAMCPLEDGSFLMAASLCAAGDIWNRTAGVDKARGRLRSKQHRGRVLPGEIIKGILDDLLGDTPALDEIDFHRAQKLFDHQVEWFRK